MALPDTVAELCRILTCFPDICCQLFVKQSPRKNSFVTVQHQDDAVPFYYTIFSVNWQAFLQKKQPFPGLLYKTDSIYMFCSNLPEQLIQQCVADRRCHIAAAFSALCHNIGYLLLRQNQFLCLNHIHKSHRHADNQFRQKLSCPNQFIQLYQRCGCVPHRKDQIAVQTARLSMETIARVTPRAFAASARPDRT